MPVPLVSVRNCRPEADQAARGNPEFHAHPAAAVIHEIGHRAPADAAAGNDHALIILGDVDHEILDRLHAHAVDLLDDDLGARHLELVSLRGASSRSGSRAAIRRARAP